MDYESLISITIRKKRASAEKPVISLYFDDIIFCKSSGNYALCTFMYFFSYEIKTNHLHNNGQYPGCRIRNKQHRQRPVIRENSENPHNSKADRSDNRQDHRHTGASHSTQCSRKQIHDSAQEIRNCGTWEYCHAIFYYICLWCVDPQNLRTKHICTCS